MDPELLQRFKTHLEALAAELKAGLETKSESTATVDLDTSIGRLSRMDAIQSQQIALGLKARQQQHLLRGQSALEAIRLAPKAAAATAKARSPSNAAKSNPTTPSACNAKVFDSLNFTHEALLVLCSG